MLRALLAAVIAIWSTAAFSAGTVPLAMTQQVDVNGKPLAGCLVYTYQAGTVSTPQNSFQDFGLSVALPNPMQCDQTGRVPLFWLADGLIHVRLTDASGIVYVDTTMQVLGPSSGGGGGGGAVDPTSIMSSGDIKFRQTSEVITGWVRLNGLTIGSATSGATERANSDTQNLYIYLWNNCSSPTSNNRCPVTGGLGVSGLADFNANKPMMLPDWRDRGPMGRDSMGNAARGGFISGNIASGGGDGVDTGGAFGGVNNQSLTQSQLPNVSFTVSGITLNDPGHFHQGTVFSAQAGATSNLGGGSGAVGTYTTTTSTTGITVSSQGTAASGGSGANVPTVNTFMLGTWYMKL